MNSNRGVGLDLFRIVMMFGICDLQFFLFGFIQ